MSYEVNRFTSVNTYQVSPEVRYPQRAREIVPTTPTSSTSDATASPQADETVPTTPHPSTSDATISPRADETVRTDTRVAMIAGVILGIGLGLAAGSYFISAQITAVLLGCDLLSGVTVVLPQVALKVMTVATYCGIAGLGLGLTGTALMSNAGKLERFARPLFIGFSLGCLCSGGALVATALGSLLPALPGIASRVALVACKPLAIAGVGAATGFGIATYLEAS